MPRLRIAPRIALLAFSLLATAGLWALTAHWIETEHHEAIDAMIRDSGNLARSLEEHTVRTIQAADQAVLFLSYEYARQGPSLDISAYLGSGVILGDIFNLFSLVDEHGDVVASSKQFTPTNLSDREHVRVHAEADTGRLFISKPVLGRVSEKWSIQMTRRLNKPDGSFGGVAVVSLDPYYFARFYADVDRNNAASVTLIGRDGVIRARHPAAESGIGKDLNAEPTVVEMLRKGGMGHYRAVSAVDGIERLYSYRALSGYPLLVIVGLSIEEAMRPFRDARAQAILQASIGSAGIVAATIILLALISRLERSRSRALQASRSKSEFIANMSHELRTPLNGILGYAELLRGDLEGSLHAEFAEAIHMSGTHLLEIVNDVLDIGKIEAGHMKVDRTPESPERILRQAVAAHLSAAKQKDLALKVEIGQKVPPLASLDRTKVLRVLNNLLHNAVKFTEKGLVDARVDRRGDELVFTVKDTGPGIPFELHEAIFDKFVQADSSVAKRHEGTGLGLALCRDLCALMDGRIWVRSKRGEGAIFIFTVPLEMLAETATEAA